MDTRERLVETAKDSKTILCFGIDPDMKRIGEKAKGETPEESLGPYFHGILEKLVAEKEISAIKPNYAFFAQYGFGGLYVLEELIQHYGREVPVILDAKRGDIGKTGMAYAKELYDFWGADAVTVSPYMGEDSVKPFVREGKLAYVLCRTSNKGAADFQELKVGRKMLYEKVLEKAMEWECGIVVGATSDAIKGIVKKTGNKVPMLIPGIGTQGGDLEMVMKAVSGNAEIHRINASSSIAYAFEKHGGSPAKAALKEANKLNETIRAHL